MPLPNFIRVENDTVYFNKDGYFIFFVPESYFDKKCAVIEGEYVELIGILNYTIKKDDNDKNWSKDLHTFEWYSRFTTKPNRIEKVKDLQLTEYSEPADYRLLYYTNNYYDEIITSTKVAQDITNVEDIFRLFVLTGNVPPTIEYDKIYKIFMESIMLNGASYGISAQILGLIPAELCRDSKDLSRPFRLAKSSNMLEYTPISVSKIPKYNGSYASITSENWDNALMGAISHPESKDSPLEKIVMGV